MALKGINLGGWLVIERWMTPSLFRDSSALNEYQLVQTTNGRRRIEQHHATFITEDDIRWCADAGIELLRVPVGYWIFGDASPYVGAIERLDWLVDTAERYGLKLLIDLHGAPGAQNARDHSGSGNQSHSTRWLKNRSAKKETIDMLCRLASRYWEASHVWGIELLNEPSMDYSGLRLVWWYRGAYRALIKVARPGTRIVFSDGFRPWMVTAAFFGMTRRAFPVVMDIHLYYCFGERNKRRSLRKQTKRVGRRSLFIKWLSWMQPVMVGEWSGALPLRLGDEQSRQFVFAQQVAYRGASAHCYWSYKTESRDKWSFRDMYEKGMIE